MENYKKFELNNNKNEYQYDYNFGINNFNIGIQEEHNKKVDTLLNGILFKLHFNSNSINYSIR